MKNNATLRRILLFAVLFGNTPTWSQQPKQYKRVHQQALKQIITGRAPVAIDELQKFVKKFPNDAESHYMLAVGYARVDDRPRAIDHIRRAIDLGLPPARFVAGSLTGLDSLGDDPVMQDLSRGLAAQPSHGPMLGTVTGDGVCVWIRTVRESTVRVSAVAADSEPVWSAPLRTTQATDMTSVMQLRGLRPETNYEYTIHIDGRATKNENYRFKTAAARNTPIRFRAAFGGGSGFVPENERAWNTIANQKPDVLLLLGDNVYSDDPTTPEMQHYCYYRRQSRPEFRALISSTPVFSIWDDHDFATNDSSGGPETSHPVWKRSVYQVFRNNWANPYYGGGNENPGCYYDFYLGDVHFVMLDGRFYRNPRTDDQSEPTMLGPLQHAWLLETISKSKGRLLVLCSPVPWVFEAKGDSRDTWNGFQNERNGIFDYLDEKQIEGVILMSADRHRSDLWRIERRRGYPLFEFNSSRLTNQHVHKEMERALFSYNKKQSFGLVDFDTTLDDPTVTYRVVTIDGEEVHSFTLKRSQLK